jgi:hypothetical protein
MSEEIMKTGAVTMRRLPEAEVTTWRRSEIEVTTRRQPEE